MQSSLFLLRSRNVGLIIGSRSGHVGALLHLNLNSKPLVTSPVKFPSISSRCSRPHTVNFTTMQRRNKTTATQPTKAKEPIHDEHDHDHGHDHSHSHGGIFHSHSHDHGQGSAEALVKVLKGEGVDRGTKVTVIGLFTNVGLTAVKGAAGWYVSI